MDFDTWNAFEDVLDGPSFTDSERAEARRFVFDSNDDS